MTYWSTLPSDDSLVLSLILMGLSFTSAGVTPFAVQALHKRLGCPSVALSSVPLMLASVWSTSSFVPYCDIVLRSEPGPLMLRTPSPSLPAST